MKLSKPLFFLYVSCLSLNSLQAMEESHSSEYTFTPPLPQKNLIPVMDVLSSDKENLPPLINFSADLTIPSSPLESGEKEHPLSSKLISQIQDIKKQIASGHEHAEKQSIIQAYEAFKATTDYDDQEWESLAQHLQAYKWPSQRTWKETVGGHLFFPKQIFEWENSIDQTYLLNRIDTLWALIIGGKLNHPICKFYLMNTLHKIRSLYNPPYEPPFFSRVINQAFEELKQCGDNPDACYTVGRGYWQGNSLLKDFDDEKATKWHKQGKDLKNQFKALNIRRRYENYYKSSPRVTVEDYIQLAQKGYPLAYLEAAGLIEDFEEKCDLLEFAASEGVPSALMKIGILYQDFCRRNKDNLENLDEALEETQRFYREAAEQGVPESYIMLSRTYVSNAPLEGTYGMVKKLNSLDPEIVNRAISYLEKAGQAHHQKAWDELGSLYYYLYHQAIHKIHKVRSASSDKESSKDEERIWLEKKNEYSLKCYLAFKHALALGDVSSYFEVEGIYPPEVYHNLVKEHGPSPYNKAFRDMIKKFWKED